jgi:hypothetical protein
VFYSKILEGVSTAPQKDMKVNEMMEKGLVIKPVPRTVITGLQIQNTSSICIRIPMSTCAHTHAMNNNI